MANGDIKEYGYWECYDPTNTIYYHGGHTDIFTEVIYEDYAKVALVNEVTTEILDKLRWVEYTINGKKAYIASNFAFGYITPNQANDYCNNIVELDDGNTYTFSMLSYDQWINLPDLVTDSLYLASTGDYEIITSDYTVVDVDKQYTTITGGNGSFSVKSFLSENDKNGGTTVYVPVLVQDNGFNDGDIIKFGRWKYGSTEYLYDNMHTIDYSRYENLRLEVDYHDTDAISWVSAQIDNRDYYMPLNTVINYISFNEAKRLCNTEYIIDGTKYVFTLLTRAKWESIPEVVYRQLDYPLYTSGSTHEYLFTSEIASPYVYGAFRTSSSSPFSTDLIPDTQISSFDQTNGRVSFVPILLKKYLVDTPADGSGYQYQFDMNMVAYNNSPSDGTNIYPPSSTSYLYTNPSDYSNNNYNNIAKTKNNITFVKSGSGALITYKVYINNEMHYISKRPVFTHMNSGNVNDLLNKLRNFTIDGVTYEIKLLSESQWKILNHKLYRDDKVDTVLNRGHDTWDDGSVHETLLTTWMVTSSYGYYSDDTDVDSNYQRAYFQCGWFKENNFPSYSTEFLDTIGEYGCFYPVIKKYNPNNEKNIEKFGTLQITRSESTRLYSQPINSDYTSCPVHTGNTFTFVSTSNENLKWKWIKTKLNDKIIYISKVFLDADMEPSDIINNMKDITIDGIPYRMRLLSMDEWKSIDKEILYQIDFGICKNRYERQNRDSDEDYYRKSTACFRTLTSTTYASSGNYEWFGGYDKIYHQRYVTGNTLERGNDGAFPDQLKWGYLPVLELLNIPPTISGSDSNLGDKTQTFSVSYTVNDEDSNDILTITEKLNGTTVRTINNAVRNQSYSFSVTSSQFANLALYETSTIEITVSDGKLSATRTYTFRKTNTAPVINYTGSDNLGIINSKPTIKYTVTDAEGDDITITERLNGKVLQTYTVSSGTECTVNIPNISWLGCGNSTNTIEINARDSAGGSSNKTITFTRAIDRIEVITNPIKTDKAVTKISLEVGWNTENASGQVFVCNNAYDAHPTWENMTNSVGSNLVYNLTNTTKTAAEWGVSVKVIVKKDGGSTGEVSLYSIKGTYE